MRYVVEDVRVPPRTEATVHDDRVFEPEMSRGAADESELGLQAEKSETIPEVGQHIIKISNFDFNFLEVA